MQSPMMLGGSTHIVSVAGFPSAVMTCSNIIFSCPNASSTGYFLPFSSSIITGTFTSIGFSARIESKYLSIRFFSTLSVIFLGRPILCTPFSLFSRYTPASCLRFYHAL